MHRWSILIIIQRDATQSSLFIILQVHFTCFGCQPHPSSGVHKTVTVTTASNVAKLSWTRWREAAAQKIWPVPEAVVRVLCTPDGGCGWHPKHIEWTCRIINRLLCVASRWTIINIYLPKFVLLHLPTHHLVLMLVCCKRKPIAAMLDANFIIHITLQTEIILPCTGSLFYLTTDVCHFLQLYGRASGPSYVGYVNSVSELKVNGKRYLSDKMRALDCVEYSADWKCCRLKVRDLEEVTV